MIITPQESTIDIVAPTQNHPRLEQTEDLNDRLSEIGADSTLTSKINHVKPTSSSTQKVVPPQSATSAKRKTLNERMKIDPILPAKKYTSPSKRTPKDCQPVCLVNGMQKQNKSQAKKVRAAKLSISRFSQLSPNPL